MIRIGHGFDAHPLVVGRRLVIGGVEIPFERGALGHSDADVLAHAVADALLGAAALGDLGTFFPASDARWKDASSIDLLERAARHAFGAGYHIGNVDSTVVVDEPKLAAFVPAMRANLARAMQLHVEAVSVKAKSSEGLGYTGDGSGIAAYAVALLQRT